MNRALRWSISISTLAGSLALAVPGTAGAAPAPAGPQAIALAPAFGGRLYGVSTPDSRDVWAVGLTPSGSLIVHWNGSGWSDVQPNTGYFIGVAGSGPRDQWAVGGTNWFSPSGTLIEHWNGSRFTLLASPNPPGGLSVLYGVRAASRTDIWAVGTTDFDSTLIIHWNGKAWS